MRKVFCKAIFSNFEKEESWLNEMAANGYNYTDNFVFRYAFDEGKPGEYIYRIILLEKHHNHYESHKYIKFIEETGAECVFATMRWAYFRQKAVDGPFEIYTDTVAKISHYKRNLSIAIILFCINAFYTIINFSLALSRKNLGNLIPATLTAIVACIFAYSIYLYTKRILELKRDKQIHE